METMRSTWTDERFDDLAGRMDRGFDRVDTAIHALRAEMNTRFERVDGRLDSMQRTMFGMLATIVVGFLVTNL